MEDRLMAKADAVAFVSETVHVDLPPEFRVAGVQLSADSAARALRPNGNVRLAPFRLAVTVAIASLTTVAAVAVKEALEAPAATLTEDGTVTAVLSSERATVPPPASAAPSVTVQVLEPGVSIAAGLQLSAVN